jgi:hypothetical protein
MAMLVSDIGDLLRLTSWDDAHPLGFTDSVGAAADPTTVSLIVRKPDGTVTTYTLAGGAGREGFNRQILLPARARSER